LTTPLKMHNLFNLVWFSSIIVVFSTIISGSISDSTILPSLTYISLSAPGSQYTAFITQSGKFEIRNVDVGSYLLHVHCPTFVFKPLRVDVEKDFVVVHSTFRGNEWDHIGPVEPFPILLQVISKAQHFTSREGFSLMSLFGNPMLLMAVFMSLMIYVIPKMTANLDPEAIKELNERQNKMGKSMNFDAASFLSRHG